MIKLSADLNRPVQKDFAGLGAVYHAFAGMPDDAGRVYTEEQCELEAKRAGDMRVKVVRSYFSWYAWDEKTNTWDWDNERCTAFYNWARRLKKYGIQIAINTGWWNIGDLMGDWHMGACPFTVKGDWKKTVDNYAAWVSQLVDELIIKRGLDNIKYFCLFTEPNEFICPSVPYENAQYRDCWYDCAKAAHDRLVADDRRKYVKLMGPQEGCAFRSWFTEWAIKEKHVDEFIDIFSQHDYLTFPEADPSDVHSGNKAMIFAFTGCRIQQDVVLEPNTDYVASIWTKLKSFVPVTPDSNITFGIFNEGSFWHYYTHYCDKRDCLYTETVNADKMADEWRKFEFKFNSGEGGKKTFCIFSDIRRQDGKKDSYWEGLPFYRSEGATLLVDDASLRKADSPLEILADPSFESHAFWNSCWAKMHNTNAYNMWTTFEKDRISFLPDDKKDCYWHDEYSVSNLAYNKLTDYRNAVLLALGQVAMMNNGQKGSFLWTLFDQQWPNNHTNSADSFVDGDHRCGLMPILTRTLVPYYGFYSWGLVSRYTGGDGTRCYTGFNHSSERVEMNVNELPDGNITVTVVNYSDKEQDISLEFNRCFMRDFNRHSFVGAECVPDETATLPGIDKVFKNVENKIEDTMPAWSVRVYTTITD